MLDLVRHVGDHLIFFIQRKTLLIVKGDAFKSYVATKVIELYSSNQTGTAPLCSPPREDVMGSGSYRLERGSSPNLLAP